jgi:threonine dehydrogenase-like Zn-dependent dehydrogenase
MKAAVLEAPCRIVVKDIPMRSCASDEVLVKVSACGICGSDIKYYKGDNPWALHTLGHHVDNPTNMVLGHEFCGQVTAVGHDRFSNLLGKRVFVEPFNTCGLCHFCRTGRYNLCKKTRHIGHGAGWDQMDYFPGGMAEYCPAWGTHAYVLPDTIDDEEATFLDPLAVAVHAVSLSRIKPGCSALVLGSGPVGLLIAQVARASGATEITCTDRFDKALETVKTVGIDHAIDIRSVNLIPYVLAHTHNQGVDIIFDTVGTKETQEQALRLLASGGTLVNMVSQTEPMTYRLMDISGEKHITSSSNNLYGDVVTAINLLSHGKVHVKPLITHRFKLEEINKGFDVLLNREKSNAIKVIIHP